MWLYGWLIAGIIYVSLNIIYFVRRKALFAKDYSEEVEVEKEISTVEEVKTEETAPLEVEETVEEELAQTETEEQFEPESSPTETVEETPKVDPVETEGYTQVISTAIENDTAEVKEPTHKVCKECGSEVLAEDAIFCTNCGKKLEK
ncbi:zinc ribbon domain-containing protein [Solobacterium moorei]